MGIVTDFSLEQEHLLHRGCQIFTGRGCDRFIAKEVLWSELGEGLTVEEDQGHCEEQVATF